MAFSLSQMQSFHMHKLRSQAVLSTHRIKGIFPIRLHRAIIKVIASLALLFSPSAFAHEYWLDPIDAAIQIGEEAIVDIRNGQNFSGAAFAFDPDRIERINISNNAGRNEYKGRLGDYPAIGFEAELHGLHSIEVDSKPTELVYDSWEKFTEFLDYHGFTSVAKRHLEKGYSKLDIKESYVRSAKTLIVVSKENKETPAVQFDIKADQLVLSPNNALFEIVLLANPLAQSNSVEAQILYKGKPLADRQVEMFWNGIKGFRRTSVTNSNGIVSFPLVGNGSYMLNAVQLVEPEDNSDYKWLSYWASITFEL